MHATIAASRQVAATLAILTALVVVSAGSSAANGRMPAPSVAASEPAAPLAAPGEDPSQVTGDAASFWLNATIDRGLATDTASGWLFDISASGGVPSESTYVTPDDSAESDASGLINVTLDAATAVVSVTIHMQSGFLLQDAYCTDPTKAVEADPDTGDEGEPAHLGTLDGSTLTFELSPGLQYACEFVVRPTHLPSAKVIVRAMMDPDPDTDGGEGRGGAGWWYDIDATGGTTTAAAVRTRSNGETSFKVAVDLGSSKVRISQRERASAPFLGPDCWDYAGEDEIVGGITSDGLTVTFGVEPGGIYICQMWNAGEPATTHAGTRSAPPPPATDAAPRRSVDPTSPIRGLALAAGGAVALLAAHRRRRMWADR